MNYRTEDFLKRFNLQPVIDATRGLLPVGASLAQPSLIQTLDGRVKKIYWHLNDTVWRFKVAPCEFEGYEIFEDGIIRRYSPSGELVYKYVSAPGVLIKKSGNESIDTYYYNWENFPPDDVKKLAGEYLWRCLGWAWKNEDLYVYYNIF